MRFDTKHIHSYQFYELIVKCFLVVQALHILIKLVMLGRSSPDAHLDAAALASMRGEQGYGALI